MKKPFYLLATAMMMVVGITSYSVADNMPARNYAFLLFGHGGGFDKNVDYEKDLRKADPTQPGTNRAVLYDEWISTPRRT